MSRTIGTIPRLALLGYAGIAALALLLSHAWIAGRGEERSTTAVHFAAAAGALNLACLAISTLEVARRARRTGAAPPAAPTPPAQSRAWIPLLRNVLLAAAVINAMRLPENAYFACFQLCLLLIAAADCWWSVCKSLARATDGAWSAGGGSLAALMFCAGGAFWFVTLFLGIQLVLGVAVARLSGRSAEPPALIKGERRIEFPSHGGIRLSGVYLEGDPGAPGIVFCHGIADRGAGYTEIATILRGAGYHSVRFDLRAHGESGGAVCSAGVFEARDVEAACAYLRAQPGVDRERILLLGHSLGAAAALHAAPRLESAGLRGIVAIAPATDLQALAVRRMEAAWVLARPCAALAGCAARLFWGLDFERDSALATFGESKNVPVLIAYSPDDAVIPALLAREFEERYPERVELLEVPGAAHNELGNALFDLDSPCFDRIRTFLREQ
ncbi:MAG: alpha/beta fold hydrolase [Planctomycetes bacterium]|nr:alpha/beta fold hydrolase [Planctomycetota bacterium]